MMRAFRSPTLNRAAFAVICLMIVLTGAGHLLQGRVNYQNYKGFSAFAPFAILVGVLGFALVIWRPTFFAQTEKRERRGRARPSGPTHSHRKRR